MCDNPIYKLLKPLRLMKPYFTIAAFLLVALAACKKSDDTNTTDPNAMVYTITGVENTNIPVNESRELALGIGLKSGKAEMVTLGLSGVPERVVAKLSNTSGTPPFTSTLSFTFVNASQGTYPITFTSTTASGV